MLGKYRSTIAPSRAFNRSWARRGSGVGSLELALRQAISCHREDSRIIFASILHLIIYSSLLALAAVGGAAVAAPEVLNSGSVDPARLAKLATVSPLYQSFNVEMVEITGGRFWASYDAPGKSRYAQRAAIDLSNPRLNVLVKGLSPAYMRISGTWANSTYIPTPSEPARLSPPPGFDQTLTVAQWRNAVRFARRNRLALVTSFPVSTGARAVNGRWSPVQAQRLISLTRKFDGRIAAAEFFNEPNLAKLGRLPDGYSIKDYDRDFTIFRDFARRNAPEMLILGPGSSGAGGDLRAEDLLRVNGADVDAVSYHFYGALSQRCEGNQARLDAALDEHWLGRTEADFEFYAKLRDRYAPGRSIWLSETAQAACGGSPWAAGYRDTFRYIDQLGRLAQRGVWTVIHNTLAASEYALIDGNTMAPRPSYWAALLWRRLMGPTVLQSPFPQTAALRSYAHCTPGSHGRVTILLLNLGSERQSVSIPGMLSVYVLAAPHLDAATVSINGRIAQLTSDGRLPHLTPRRFADQVELPSQSIGFVVARQAGNSNCR